MDELEFLVRAAQPEDAEEMAKVHVQTWREAYEGLLPRNVIEEFNEERRLKLWTQIIALSATARENAQFVAEGGGKIIGFGSCGPNRSPECIAAGFEGEISTLYVLSAHQRHGVGAALFRRMANHLVNSGIGSASLWVLRENLKARTFYERLGGRAFSEDREEHPEGDIVEVAIGWLDLACVARGGAN